MLVSRIFAEAIQCEPRKEHASPEKRQSTSSFCQEQPKRISNDSFADVLRGGLAVESVVVATSEGLPISVTVFQPSGELGESLKNQARKSSEGNQDETSPLLKDESARAYDLQSVTARLRYRLPGMALSATPVVIIAPAVGADRKLYRPLASFLAAHGIITVVFEYRADLSSSKSALFGTPEMIHEAAYDLQSVLDWICHVPPEDSISQDVSTDGEVSERLSYSEGNSSRQPGTPNGPFSLHIIEDYFAVSNAPEVASSSLETSIQPSSADALPSTSTTSPQEHNGRRHVFILGHGFGGLLIGSVLRPSAHRHIAGALLISSGLPHTPLPRRRPCSYFRRLYWRVVPKLRKVMPCLFRAFGVMPGSFSASAVRWRRKEKRRSCGPAFPCGALCVSDPKPRVSPLSRKVGTFTRPVLAYSFSDDPDGPQHAVDALLLEYGTTDFIHRHRRPQDYGLKRLGARNHVLFRCPNILWHEAAEWIWWTATWAEAFSRSRGSALTWDAVASTHAAASLLPAL